MWLPLLCLKMNTRTPRGLPTGNTSDCNSVDIAKCYPDVAVNSPHPVRDIGDLRFPKLNQPQSIIWIVSVSEIMKFTLSGR